MKKFASPVIVVTLTIMHFIPAFGQNEARSADLQSLARTDLEAFAHEITKDGVTDFERARLVVGWFAENFDWTATDYQKRTVQDILERSGGNCNELAMVTLATMEKLDFKIRRIREINLHVNTPRRQATASGLVAEKGKQYSVFGQRHNDHVWIEIYDSATGEWFPADPSIGVVGKMEWLAARYGFGERYSLNPNSSDMIAPFAIYAYDENAQLAINRSAYYAIDGFNDLYDGKLSDLSVWEQWVDSVDGLDDLALGAFLGETDLHQYGGQIKKLWETYYQLREEWMKE